MDGTSRAIILRTVTHKDLTHNVLALRGELVGYLLPNAVDLGASIPRPFARRQGFPAPVASLDHLTVGPRGRADPVARFQPGALNDLRRELPSACDKR